MKAHLLIPQIEEIELQDLSSLLSGLDKYSLTPFADEVIAFCSTFANKLFKDHEARRFPELQALAFWMRKTELLKLKEQFAALENEVSILVPRGLVFHVPPSNVDTIFIYSWLLSIVAGNKNIIRLSSQDSPQITIITRIFAEALTESADAVRQNTIIVSYGHEREITAAISAHCDVRVIWGGDETVNAIRSIPLPVHAKELTFPDRYSFALIDSASYLALAEAAQKDLVERFYNDTYWFNQLGCSSPRVVIWRGERGQGLEAGKSFFQLLQQTIAAKGYALETGAVLNKLAFAYRAILDQPVTSFASYGNELTLLELGQLRDLSKAHCGAGLLFQFYTPELQALADAIERRDQTLAHFGFSLAELKTLARALNGRGIDRMVPIGQALNFNRYWDGYDLLQEMTRRVYLA